MQIAMEIPKEFESKFEFDRFADSLARVASDIEALGFELSGRYERETITMIRKAFENATPLPKGHGALKDADKLALAIAMIRDKCNEQELFQAYDNCVDEIIDAPTIIEADEEGTEEFVCDNDGDCEHCDWATCPQMEGAEGRGGTGDKK